MRDIADARIHVYRCVDLHVYVHKLLTICAYTQCARRPLKQPAVYIKRGDTAPAHHRGVKHADNAHLGMLVTALTLLPDDPLSVAASSQRHCFISAITPVRLDGGRGVQGEGEEGRGCRLLGGSVCTCVRLNGERDQSHVSEWHELLLLGVLFRALLLHVRWSTHG